MLCLVTLLPCSCMDWADPEGAAPLYYEFGYLNRAGQPQILQPRTASQPSASGLTLPANLTLTVYASVSDEHGAATHVLLPVRVTGELVL